MDDDFIIPVLLVFAELRLINLGKGNDVVERAFVRVCNRIVRDGRTARYQTLRVSRP